MSSPLTILFQHHKTDAVTLRRFWRLVRLNPGVPVVPLTHASPDVLPNTFDSASFPELATEDGWRNADLSIYYWFRHARNEITTARRYIFVEYDALYRVSMAEFYREVWDEDFAGAQLYFAGPHRDWSWFRSVYKLPEKLQSFAAGVSPLSGVLLSHRALQAIADGNIPLGIYAELRLATLANAHGFDMVELPYAKKRNITWRQDFVRFGKPTQAYHPLKEICALDDF